MAVSENATAGAPSEAVPLRGARSTGATVRARRTLDLLLGLTASDLRARYGRGPARGVKWLLDPFAAVGVYLLLVASVVPHAGRAPGLSLACAVVPFQLVMMSVVNALGATRLRVSIITNVRFPRALLPISSALTESVAFGASLILPPLMMAAYGVPPTPALVWLPVALALTELFAIALAYPASLIGVWWPDLTQFAISAVRTLFFLAPGLVALARIHGTAHDLIRFNPLTGIFETYRAVLVHGHAPPAFDLLYPAAIAAALLVAFVPLYRREQGQFAKLSESAWGGT